LHDARHYVRAGGVHEERQFVELVFEIFAAHTRELHTNEHDLLAEGALNEGGGI